MSTACSPSVSTGRTPGDPRPSTSLSSEDGAGWLTLFRGLSRVRLVTSDAHRRLVN